MTATREDNPTGAVAPKRSISFLQTGQSAKSRFCEPECSEAAIDDFTLPATTGWSGTDRKAVIQASFSKPSKAAQASGLSEWLCCWGKVQTTESH
jgi:hypothetical protein